MIHEKHQFFFRNMLTIFQYTVNIQLVGWQKLMDTLKYPCSPDSSIIKLTTNLNSKLDLMLYQYKIGSMICLLNIDCIYIIYDSRK